MQNGQNPLYTGGIPRANPNSLYTGGGPRESDAVSITNIFAHHPHLGHHQPGNSPSNPSMPADSLSGSSRDHHALLHGRYSNKTAPGLNGIIVPGLPSFGHAPQRTFDSPIGSGGSIVHHGVSSNIHTANLNEAFVNSFGLSPGSFLTPYFADRTTRTPSPLHRFLQNQLLGGHHANSSTDNHFSHDDLLLDSSGSFRGLNLSNNFAHSDRQHADPLMGSGHLSRSLDDLSAMLDNSNDSVDLSMPHRHSSSPDESINNDLTQSESVSSTVQVRGSSRSTSKRRANGRIDNNSRTCPTCGKAFGNSSGLAKHRLTHSDERKYMCNICMKSFKRQDHLSGHMLTHSDKKPFECPVESCGKSYCDSRSLKRHLDQHEPWLVPEHVRLLFNDTSGENAEERRSQVSLSGRDFHLSGSELKPFVCQICRKRFKNGPALNGHMRLHGGFSIKMKGGCDLYASAPPSVQPPKSIDSSSQNSCDLNLADVSPHSVQPHWNPASELSSETASVNDQLSSLNQVAVIRHVPPVIVHSALPPVKSLASPVNSPTTATFSFFPVSPVESPSTPIPPQHPQFPATPSTAPATLALPVVAVNGKIRRHSDSDNLVPPKRLKPTVADRLRHTINMNIVRRMNSASPERDFNNPFGFKPGPLEDFDVVDEKPPQSFLFPVPALLESAPYDGNLHGNFPPSNEDRLSSDVFLAKSPESVTSSSGSSSVDYPEPTSSISPSLSLIKKQKRRPEPLYIPPYASTAQPMSLSPGNETISMTHSMSMPSPLQTTLLTPPPVSSLLSPGIGYQSRLRSPLPREGTEKHISPPPYTPPPMLSPNRHGSGLFWNVISGSGSNGTTTPQSGAKFNLLRRSLSSSSTGHLDNQSYFRRASTSGSVKDEHDSRESPFYFGPALDAPVTDMMPHINLGDRHQADLPALNYHRNEKESLPEDLMCGNRMYCRISPIRKMVPCLFSKNSKMRDYIALADSGVVPKSGRNTELAYHLLYLTSGDVRLCTKALLSTDTLCAIVPPHHPIREYRYQESDLWSQEEIATFSSALHKYDKDFYLVSAAVQSKTTKQCVEYYYCWKKQMPDEYKRVRGARSRFRRQEELVTRSKTAAALASEQKESAVEQSKPVTEAAKQKDSTGPYACPQPNCGTLFATKQALSAHSRVHLPRSSNRVAATLDKCPPPDPKGQGSPGEKPAKRRDASPYQESESTEFPCRICGKVFQGVKSRNAHMKVHRLTENQSASLVSTTAQ
ncbi:transcriptional-regulating factor 1-like [Paramacrobiotus metropolitanus]|uniref:transcriptional-regulating factor 1-like n=1 Tax=Paramacrobiotus metropolitanus TaxID=2943436 RepID=UPI0024457123|nr:transcriptional-regulating factor 1-like [Paramacrobiotus metropolitanus]